MVSARSPEILDCLCPSVAGRSWPGQGRSIRQQGGLCLCCGELAGPPRKWKTLSELHRAAACETDSQLTHPK